MKIAEIIKVLEAIAPPCLQESYDNAGLLTGCKDTECTGVLCSLDAIEEVIDEAISCNANLVVAHHPIIFGGLKKINGNNYVERTIIKAIKNDIAIYAIHTNLDNILHGVNGKMAQLLQLQNCKVLQARTATLKKLYSFVPTAKLEKVRTAVFEAGGGRIGLYDQCSFNMEGVGTFRAGAGSNPFVGEQGKRHEEPETKFEIIFPAYLERQIVDALLRSHPYEEVAYDIVALSNNWDQVGSGLVGTLAAPVTETEFLENIAQAFRLDMVRHTALMGRKISKVAVCGGAGSFLIKNALAAGADVFVTADMKYHEFFDADGRMLICDIGHYESEQFTVELLNEVLVEKFPTFAVLKSKLITNPVHYFSVKHKSHTDHGQR